MKTDFSKVLGVGCLLLMANTSSWSALSNVDREYRSAACQNCHMQRSGSKPMRPQGRVQLVMGQYSMGNVLTPVVADPMNRGTYLRHPATQNLNAQVVGYVAARNIK